MVAAAAVFYALIKIISEKTESPFANNSIIIQLNLNVNEHNLHIKINIPIKTTIQVSHKKKKKTLETN